MEKNLRVTPLPFGQAQILIGGGHLKDEFYETGNIVNEPV